MAYITSTSYSPVGGLSVAAEKPGILSGLADLFGSVAEDLKNAVVSPKPAVIKNGVVLGVAKKPRGGKPGVLKPASGQMVARGKDGSWWKATVKKGAVVAAAPVAAPARPTAATASVTTVMATTNIATAPVATTVMGSTLIAATPMLPARGVYGGRLPTATAFSGRPAGSSSTVAVAAVPIAATMVVPGSTQVAQTTEFRSATATKPMYGQRWLNPAYMVDSSL